MTAPDLASMHAALAGAADPEMVARETRLRSAQLAADIAALNTLLAKKRARVARASSDDPLETRKA